MFGQAKRRLIPAQSVRQHPNVHLFENKEIVTSM